MTIPDAPPDPTYYRVMLSDPEGNDSADLTRVLEDCGLKVFKLEELSHAEFEVETSRKPVGGWGDSQSNRRVG